jgi:hypothetical protein
VYENVLDLGYRFVRQDLSGGEGLDWFPRRFDDEPVPGDATRFFDSSDFDFSRPRPGEQHTIKTGAGDQAGAVGGNSLIWATSEDTFYEYTSGTVRWWLDEGGGAADGTQAGLSGTDILISESDVGLIWANGTGNWSYKPHNSSTWVVVTNVGGVLDNFAQVWWAKDRFIGFRTGAAEGGTLEEIDFGATGSGPPTFSVTTVIIDSTEARITQVVDGGTAILAVGTDGYVRSYVPAQQSADASDIFLELRGRTQMPEGETPVAVAESQGVVLILTYDKIVESTVDGDHHRGVLRAYRAEVLDARFDFILGGVQLLREWNGIANEWDAKHFTRIATTRDDMYFLIHEDPGTETVADFDAALWKFDVITGGLWREISFTAGASPGASVNVLTRLQKWKTSLYFNYDDAAITAVRRVQLETITNTDSDNSVPGRQTLGWLITPLITFGIDTELHFIEADMVTKLVNTPSGGYTAKMWISTEPAAINDRLHSSWQLVIDGRPTDAGVEGTFSFSEPLSITANQAAIQIEITSGGTLGAGFQELVRFGVRAYPKQRDFIAEIPVNISDYIEVPGRAPVRLPGWGDEVHRYLMNQSGESMDLAVFDPPVTIRGIVDVIAAPVPYVTDRGSAGRYCTVRFRGNRITDRVFKVGMAFETDTATGATVA